LCLVEGDWEAVGGKWGCQILSREDVRRGGKGKKSRRGGGGGHTKIGIIQILNNNTDEKREL